MEYTYLMIKPDGNKDEIITDIFTMITDKGFEIVKHKTMLLNKEIISQHYAHLLERPFFPELERFMTSKEVIPMIVKGNDVVNQMRLLIGATDPKEAAIGTIREKYGSKESVTYNVIHGADSKENAIVEIKRFFNIDEDELNTL